MPSFNPLSAGIELITGIISRVWPDKTEQQKAQLEAALRADENLTKLLTGQMEVNAAEAANPNRTWLTWREIVGYTCAAAFAWQFVLLPISLFVAASLNHPISPPTFDITTMVTVLMGMLGIGGLKTYERVKGL